MGKRRIDPDEWAKLWAGIRELSGFFPDGIVFIGGIAVLLHVRDRRLPEGFVELSHDGDFYISLADFADLRDLEEVTANRRLQKHQIVKGGVEYDVYLENHNDLRVKYADAMQAATTIDGVRVASLEHLLILKLDAFGSRRGSAKGDKDERDLVKICYLLSRSKVHDERLAKYLTPEAVALLGSLRRSSAFLVLCGGNAHEARDVRKAVVEVIDRIERIEKGPLR
jgi:hypothetical protein